MDKRATNPAAQVWGAQVRYWREKAGATVEHVAAKVGNSPSAVISWERGARAPHVDTIKKLDRLLEADGSLLVGVDHLSTPRYPGGYGEYPEVEAGCVSLNAFSTMAIPGLLQTTEYAWAAMRDSVPPLDDDDIESLVAARIGRQALLSRRPPPVLGFVIEESVLRRPIGGAAVFRRQLERLVECAEMRHVQVQVMPQDTEEHSGLEGPMILFRTGDGRDLAYVEGQAGGEWVEDSEQVAVIAARHGIIRTQALRPARSIKLINEIAGEL